MAIKPELVDYIRTMIRGEHEANDTIEARLDAEGWDGFPSLIGAVFFYAVDRHFGGRADNSAIVNFVAAMRTDERAEGLGIGAREAETLIKAALDSSVAIDVEPNMAGKIQGLAVLKIMEEEKPSDAEIELLLQNAVQLAKRAG